MLYVVFCTPNNKQIKTKTKTINRIFWVVDFKSGNSCFPL